MLGARQFRSILQATRPGALQRVSARRQASTTRRKSAAHDDGDFRPPWVYLGVRVLTHTAIPVTIVYSVFFADWGERDHVFRPPRRWVSEYMQSILSLSPEEAALVQESNGQAPSNSPSSPPNGTGNQSSKQDSKGS